MKDSQKWLAVIVIVLIVLLRVVLYVGFPKIDSDLMNAFNTSSDNHLPPYAAPDSILVDYQNYETVIAGLIQSGKTPDICEKLEYSTNDMFWSQSAVKPKDVCYRDFAVAKNDPSICNASVFKDNCVSWVKGSTAAK